MFNRMSLVKKKYLVCSVIVTIFLVVGYISNAQSIVDVNPSQGMQGTSLELTVTAQGTTFSQASATVWFTQGSSTVIAPQYVSVENSNTIKGLFNLSWYPAGLYQVHAYSNHGEIVLNNGFEVLLNTDFPEITDVGPATAQQGQSLQVTITGANTNFGQGTSTTQVWFSQASSTTIYPATVVENSSTEINALFHFSYNHPIGYYDVFTSNQIDNELVKQSAFYLSSGDDPPSISDVTPYNGCSGEPLQVSITGNDIGFTQGTSTNISVWIESSNYGGNILYANNVDVINNDEISAEFYLETYMADYFYDLNLFSDYCGQLTLPYSVFINSEPIALPQPDGITSLCVNPPNTYYNPPYGGEYNSSDYLWVLEPQSAGTIIGEGMQIEIDWSNDFTGEAQISVAGINECGTGLYSPPLIVSIADNPTVAGFTFSNFGGMVQFNNTSQYADEFSWEFGDGTTSTEPFPMHSYDYDGYYTVTLHATGGSCGSDTYSEEIFINYTNISEINAEPFDLYPNPLTDILFFNKNVNSVSVYNIHGQKIIEKINTSKVNFDAMPLGVYIVKIQYANQIFTRKVIKQ
jgi:hypothetical protein